MKNSEQEKKEELEIVYSNDFRKLKYNSKLTKEEQYEYIRKSQAGDKEAFQKIMGLNQLLVLKYANLILSKNSYENFELADLMQEGNIGLMNAIKKFDLESDVEFSTYAVPNIIGYILAAVKSKDKTIAIPVGIQNSLYKIGKLKAKNQLLNNEEISDEEIINILKLTNSEYELIKIAANAETIPLTMANDDDELETNILDFYIKEDISLTDMVVEKQSEIERNKIIEDILKSLPPTYADLIIKHYGLNGNDPMGYAEIASLYNTTRQNVHSGIKTNKK